MTTAGARSSRSSAATVTRVGNAAEKLSAQVGNAREKFFRKGSHGREKRHGEIARGYWCPGAESNHRHGDFQSLSALGESALPLGTSVKHVPRPVKAGT